MADRPPTETWSILVTSPDCMDSTLPQSFLLVPHKFLQGMMNRMGVSYHKYGSFEKKFPDQATGVDQIHQRLERYLETGNVEWLMDVANYAMMEAARPSHPAAHFRATDSDESPGRINRDGSVSHDHH